MPREIKRRERKMTLTERDKIRKNTLGAPTKFRSENVDLNGSIIEVRQLNLQDRALYLTSAIDPETNATDIMKMQVNAIILSCYVPGTDERVYDDTDYDAISQDVSGGFADKLWETIQTLGNITVDEAKKN